MPRRASHLERRGSALPSRAADWKTRRSAAPVECRCPPATWPTTGRDRASTQAASGTPNNSAVARVSSSIRASAGPSNAPRRAAPPIGNVLGIPHPLRGRGRSNVNVCIGEPCQSVAPDCPDRVNNLTLPQRIAAGPLRDVRILYVSVVLLSSQDLRPGQIQPTSSAPRPRPALSPPTRRAAASNASAATLSNGDRTGRGRHWPPWPHHHRAEPAAAGEHLADQQPEQRQRQADPHPAQHFRQGRQHDCRASRAVESRSARAGERTGRTCSTAFMVTSPIGISPCMTPNAPSAGSAEPTAAAPPGRA